MNSYGQSYPAARNADALTRRNRWQDLSIADFRVIQLNEQ
jgi:hypothetical protein